MAGWSNGISIAAAIVLTPIAMGLWQRLAPAPKDSEFDHLGREELRRRNDWIDWVAVFLCFAGISLGIAPYFFGLPNDKFIGIPLIFGLMIWLPSLFVVCVCLPFGRRRLREYLRWYEPKYGISIRGVLFLYGLISMAAVIGVLLGIAQIIGWL